MQSSVYIHLQNVALEIVEFILQDPTHFFCSSTLGMQGKKGAGKSRDLQKKSRDFWTSLVPGPQDHGTFKVSRSCPVPFRPGTFPGLPGTERSCWKAYLSVRPIEFNSP